MPKKEVLKKKNVAHLLKAVFHPMQLPKDHMLLDEEEADVLYLHFEDQTGPTHSRNVG